MQVCGNTETLRRWTAMLKIEPNGSRVRLAHEPEETPSLSFPYLRGCVRGKAMGPKAGSERCAGCQGGFAALSSGMGVGRPRVPRPGLGVGKVGGGVLKGEEGMSARNGRAARLGSKI